MLSMPKLPMEQGGIGVTGFERYYMGAQFQWAARWLASYSLMETRMNPEQLKDGTLQTMFLRSAKAPVDCSSLVVTALVCLKCGLSPSGAKSQYAPAIPLLGLSVGAGWLMSTVLIHCSEVNISRVGDLFQEGYLLTFKMLADDYGLPKGHFRVNRQVTSLFREK